MRSADLLVWIHLLAIASYFGLQFGLIYMLLPAAGKAPNEQSRRAVLIAGLRFYNPFSIGALGALVITGAIRLTDLKATMGFDYFSRISGPLSLKLMLAFILIFIQTYLTFGLTFRIGRQEEVAAHGHGEPFTVEQVNAILRRTRAITWLTIILAAATMLVSLSVTGAARSGVAAAAIRPVRPHAGPVRADRLLAGRGKRISAACSLTLVSSRRRED
jgi:uncharacterized membrane protein